MLQTREAIFISHANPESNNFARWLGAKLSGMGFDVWADVMRLHGGSDWSRDLEEALRHRALKMVVVCTPAALAKQGVRNEIEIGSDLARKLNDAGFMIPLRLEPYDPPLRIAHLQYINFQGWQDGLRELVALLNEQKVPKRPGSSAARWVPLQGEGAASLLTRSEPLNSNWLRFNRLPAFIHYCEPASGIPLEQFASRGAHRWPVSPYESGVVTFASPRLLGTATRLVNKIETESFLRDGWPDLRIEAYDARRRFSDLGNRAFELFAESRHLSRFEVTSSRSFWWGDIRTVPLTQIRFDWPGARGRRQIIGESGKRGVHWHYAVGAEVRTAPVRHLRLAARLVFSGNGLDAITDVRRAHRLRRSFAKSWRNPRWRDMLLAFLWWFGSGGRELALPVSDNEALRLNLPTSTFRCPVSVRRSGEEPPDEDDPDLEYDESDEWDEGEESVEA